MSRQLLAFPDPVRFVLAPVSPPNGEIQWGGPKRLLSFVQIGLREHFQELAAAALVDGHGQQLAVTAEKERPGDARDVESFVYLATRIENDVWCVLIAANELCHFESVLVGDGQDDQPL